MEKAHFSGLHWQVAVVCHIEFEKTDEEGRCIEGHVFTGRLEGQISKTSVCPSLYLPFFWLADPIFLIPDVDMGPRVGELFHGFDHSACFNLS